MAYTEVTYAQYNIAKYYFLEYFVIRNVKITKSARKQIDRLPDYIVLKLMAWIRSVELSGLEVTRQRPGYHDEPLKGQRHGQRSLRLSRGYRAIYIIVEENISFVFIEEVSKHDY